MAVSVIAPIEPALSRTGLMLFQPFDLGKWLKLGFCAFLTQLVDGCGSDLNTGWRQGGGQPPSGPQVTDWVNQNLPLVVAVALGGLLLLAGFVALLTWLSSRGRFMFLDNIVLNRGAVVEPWRAFERLGNSLFGFSVTLTLITLLLSSGLLLLAAAIAWPDLQRGTFGPSATLALLIAGSLGLVVVITVAIIKFLLINFVVPTMYLRDVNVMEAWGITRRELLEGHGWQIVLYALMRLLLAIVTGAITFGLVCATCCIAALPYIGTVITLPLWVFLQCYTLYFMEGFGPQWRFFFEQKRCPNCGYDLRATPIGSRCPECGAPHAPAPEGDAKPFP
jgi:ssDNA-binding Zn-finger/Zn-ribbon topoisomerase 1